MALEVRPITIDEIAAFVRIDEVAFGGHPSDERIAWARQHFGDELHIAAFADGELVGSSSLIPLDLVIPGSKKLRTAAVTEVAVLPTHRRRGALTAMMRDHMDRLHAEGTPLAALWPSETPIYGRFGYGVTTWRERWRIAHEHAGLLDQSRPEGSCALVSPEVARATYPDVDERACAARPGFIAASGRLWDEFFLDPPSRREGASALFHVVYRRVGEVAGYVSYRIEQRWPEGISQHALRVVALMAVDSEAHRALWRYIFGVDLVGEITAEARPVDDPLPWLLAELRRLRRGLSDGLWLRLVDVPAALSQRCYAREDALVIELRDEFCPWNAGRFRLDAGPAGGRCAPSTADADLVLDASTLAAAYLGGARFRSLADGRRVDERRAGAIARADALFVTERAPWCQLFF